MIPLPGRTILRARILRALVCDGSLDRSGYVVLDGGPTLPFVSAVEITLLGLDDLIQESQGARDVLPQERQQIGADIELLYEEALVSTDARPIWPEWRPPRRQELSLRA